jgi:hypothetical protein
MPTKKSWRFLKPHKYDSMNLAKPRRIKKISSAKIRKLLLVQIKNILETLRGFVYRIIYSGKGQYCLVYGKHLRKLGRRGLGARENEKCLKCV